MKICTSRALFDKLKDLVDDEVEILLENNVHYTGLIIGFFFGMQEIGEPFILKWHLVKRKDRFTFGKGVLGSYIGTIFYHTELISIRFLQDNSIMVFK
jgi:hypothetical protein